MSICFLNLETKQYTYKYKKCTKENIFIHKVLDAVLQMS